MNRTEPQRLEGVSDYVVRRLKQLDVEYAFGMNGANIEDLFEAAHRAGRPRTVVAKHEFSAVAMAHGYHLRSGGLGVVLTTSGGGALNAVAPLAEALSSRIPLLAVIGQIPLALQGQGGFQDCSGTPGTPDARRVFSSVSVSCLTANSAEEVPEALERSVRAALEKRGPSVLLLPKDVQQSGLRASAEPHFLPRADGVGPPPEWSEWSQVVELLERARLPPLAVLGEDLMGEGAVEPALDLVARLDAMVAVTPGAKGLYDHRSPRFLGVTGVMGHPSVKRYLERTEVCVVVGTPLPLPARYGLESALAEKTLVSINSRPSFLELPEHVGHGAARPVRLEVRGPLVWRIAEINALLDGRRSFCRANPREALQHLEVPQVAGSHLSYESAVSTIGSFLEDDADVFVDAGNTGAALVHYLQVRGKGLFFVALGMGGMGYSFGAAIGSAIRSRKRTYVFAGDGAFFMHGMELHTAVEHELPLVAVVFNNNSHAMCELRDGLFLSGARGENVFRRSHIGQGVAAMFPSILSRAAGDFAALSLAMQEIQGHRGPAFLSVEIDSREFPPFAPFLDCLAAKQAQEDRHAHR
jgi:acetolactate synthase-1/2/3 large subunit